MMPAPRDVNKKDMEFAAKQCRELFGEEAIRNLSEMVYRLRLDRPGQDDGDAVRMVAKDGDNGEKLRSRSGSYDSLSRDYLKAVMLLGLMKP